MNFVNPLKIGGDSLQLNAQSPIASYCKAVFSHHCYQGTSIVLENLRNSQTKDRKSKKVLNNKLNGIMIRIAQRKFLTDMFHRRFGCLFLFPKSSQELIELGSLGLNWVGCGNLVSLCLGEGARETRFFSFFFCSILSNRTFFFKTNLVNSCLFQGSFGSFRRERKEHLSIGIIYYKCW